MTAALLLCFAPFATPVQETGTAPDPVEVALRRYDTLPEDEQKIIAGEMLAYVLESANSVLQGASTAVSHPRVRDAARLEQDRNRAWDADEYAPALKLKTKVLDKKSTQWRNVCRMYLRGKEPLPSVTWSWDAGRNALIQPAETPTPRAQVEAMLRGQWPADGLVGAMAAGALDARDDLDATANYFAHHYRDRAGRIYSGISLNAMWGSGRQLEVSDVEAIAWLRNVEGRDDVVSPIPEKMHDPIYEKISAGFAVVRDERALREAIAARLVDPNAPLPMTLSAMGDVIDQGWVALRHDPARMAELLAGCSDRKEVLSALVAAAQADAAEPKNAEERAAHEAARANFSTALSEAAFDAARDAGLLGFGRR